LGSKLASAHLVLLYVATALQLISSAIINLSIDYRRFTSGIAIAEPAPANMLIEIGMFNNSTGGQICQFSKKFGAQFCWFPCYRLQDVRKWLNRADHHQGSPVVEVAAQETNILNLHSTSVKIANGAGVLCRIFMTGRRDRFPAAFCVRGVLPANVFWSCLFAVGRGYLL
jgi:hypothetical protein